MKTILALDGGGVRGILPGMILAELQRRSGKGGEQFDLIVGTSTGGILGLFMALGKPASAAVDLYRCEAKSIFRAPLLRRVFDWAGLWRPRYTEHGIESALKRHFGDALMKDCRPVAVTAAQIANMSSCVMRSWAWQWVGAPAWVVGRATSAAPTYFPPTGDGYIDGGVWANNPSHVAMLLARELWPGEDYRLLSLGCGRRNTYALPRRTKHWGLLQLAPRLPEMLMGTGEDFAELVATTVLKDRYLRVQPDLEAVDSAMDRCDAAHIQDLAMLGRRSAHASVGRIQEFLA